jgi:SOS-response transcriptional repressor LexA
MGLVSAPNTRQAPLFIALTGNNSTRGIMNQGLQKSKPFSFNPDDACSITGYKKIPQPRNYDAAKQYFVLKINGDSLLDAGIAAGDWVVYRVQTTCRPGQLCVIATPHGLTARFCYPQADGRIVLTSAHQDYPPQTWLPSEVTLRGVVVQSGRDWL